MVKIEIQDLKPGTVSGVDVVESTQSDIYREKYFEWTPTALVGSFKKPDVSGGVLQTWHHQPAFDELEYHEDAEMFFFLSGVALMVFGDIHQTSVKAQSLQIVRIQPGTQISIHAGKAHFVAVAEGSEPVCAVVVSPKMEAPRIRLLEPVLGIKG